MKLNMKTALSAFMAFKQAGNAWDVLGMSDKDRIEAIMRTFGHFPVVQATVPGYEAIMSRKDIPLTQRVVELFDLAQLKSDGPNDGITHLTIKCKACGDLYSYDLPIQEADPMDVVNNIRVGKTLLDQFSSLSSGGKEVFENMIPVLAGFLLPGEEMAIVRNYLGNKNDSLETRLLGAWMFPGVKDQVADKLNNVMAKPRFMPTSFSTTCVFCHHEEHIDIPQGETI